jgi:flavin reductase
MAFDPALQRRIMGHFATGVTVVTTRFGEGDQIWGMTANSVVSLSLDPPLMLFTVDRQNFMYECLMKGRCFAVSILTVEQEAISRRFATRGPKDFSDLALVVAETGAPILAAALAFVDCRVVQVVPGGDHEIFFGEIVAGGVHDGPPLLFYSGKYGQLATPSVDSSSADYWTLEELYEHYGSF